MNVHVSDSIEHPKATPSGNGSLLVFEGPDGAGKTELAHRLVNSLRARGVECELIAFPGNEPQSLGRHVYRIHHEPASVGIDNLHPASLQTLHVAAHIDLIERRILPALQAGRIVVLDRYWWSTWVYGIVGGVKPEALDHLIQTENVYWGSILPSPLFLIQRNIGGPSPGGNRLKHEYEAFAERENGKYPIHIVQNEGDLADVATRIFRLVEEYTDVASRKR